MFSRPCQGAFQNSNVPVLLNFVEGKSMLIATERISFTVPLLPCPCGPHQAFIQASALFHPVFWPLESPHSSPSHSNPFKTHMKLAIPLLKKKYSQWVPKKFRFDWLLTCMAIYNLVLICLPSFILLMLYTPWTWLLILLTLFPSLHAFGHADLLAIKNLVTDFHMSDAHSKLEITSVRFSNP